MPTPSPHPTPADTATLAACRTTGLAAAGAMTICAALLLSFLTVNLAPDIDAPNSEFNHYLTTHHTALAVLALVTTTCAAALAALAGALPAWTQLTHQSSTVQRAIARAGLGALAATWAACSAAVATAIATPQDTAAASLLRFTFLLATMTGPITALTVVTATPRPEPRQQGQALWWCARAVALLVTAATLYAIATSAAGRGPLLAVHGIPGAVLVWAIWTSTHMARDTHRRIRNPSAPTRPTPPPAP
ncbi:hypothetical protein SAMN05216371_8120 [Streptomyces sp. TLI_053]|uniref:hypothetical protein n=1 Tax=Streptomyces sp. TLI_053 TaxID=1855352 RepID=UPI0008794B38|nr:hypothetical protein [Streptomyces sp. TLI_053]SDT83300.1 hypothetical protein SAMN05216371_8120 [Streptomyces sp. TLI_053]